VVFRRWPLLVGAKVREICRQIQPLADRIKALPLTLMATAPIARAISTAGGVRLDALTDTLMLKANPGVFRCGRDAGLGSPYRRLPSPRLFLDRSAGSPGDAGVAEPRRTGLRYWLARA